MTNLKVELWTNDCYGCDRYGKYNQIRDWVIRNGLPLQNFAVKRIVLNPDWQREAEQIGIEPPFVKFITEKGCTIMSYEQFKQDDYIDWERSEDGEKIEIVDESEPKKTVKIRKKKTASIKKKETKTTSEE